MFFVGFIAAIEQEHAASRAAGIDELIARTGEQDAAAFAELYKATDSSVFAFALSILKNRQDAEDVMQETYLKIRQSAHSYNSAGHGMSWMLTITKNLAFMHLRSRGKASPVDSEVMEQALGADTGDSQTELENRMILDAALELLNETQRQIVILHAVSGLKHREISELLELPLSTVLSHYSRSLSKLKKFLEERWQ